MMNGRREDVDGDVLEGLDNLDTGVGEVLILCVSSL